MNLEQSIEALLFWRGEPTSIKELSKALSTKDTDIFAALRELEASLASRGIVLMRKVDKSGAEEIMLATSPEAGALIERLAKEDLSRDLGKASLETLSIILYKGPVKRSEIDYIRGVNSTFILRNLLIRGLIEKKQAPDDNRASVYGTSFELLSHLGIARAEDLPNYSAVLEEIQKFRDGQDASEQNEPPPVEKAPEDEAEEEDDSQILPGEETEKDNP